MLRNIQHSVAFVLRRWPIIFLLTATRSEPQFPVPYPVPYPSVVHMIGPPQPVPVGVPVGVPIPVGIPIPAPETTTKSTTTTEKPTEAPILKIYLPIPPHHWGLPQIPPINFSIPLPDCNLTFKFPSPPQFQLPAAPMYPIPFGVPVPPPVVMIPLPPVIRIPIDRNPSISGSESKSKSLSCESESDSDSSSSSDRSRENKRRRKRRRKKRKKKYGIYRSQRRKLDFGKNYEEPKPVLSYVAKNGDVKLQRRLNKEDALLLVQSGKKRTRTAQDVQVVADNLNSNEKSRVLVVAKPYKTDEGIRKRGKIVMRRSSHQLSDGTKELMFKPPANKKITNISMSFKIE